MTAEERQHRIEEYLQKVEFASLEELAQKFEASVSTVRRDVSALEATGTIKRTHGGARLTSAPRSDEFIFSTRDTHQLAEKQAIGRACAELIQPNQTVIIDAGTTCFHVARELEAKTPHIITNSLPVANHFSATHKLEVVVSGGVIYPRLGVLVGPLAVAAFREVHADVAIMSCGGIGPDGITNSHGLLIEIQKAMMHAAARIILCVDHTKFGRQSITRLCGLEWIDTLVTDQPPAEDMLKALEKAGTELICATEAGSTVLLEAKPAPARRPAAADVDRAEGASPSEAPPAIEHPATSIPDPDGFID